LKQQPELADQSFGALVSRIARGESIVLFGVQIGRRLTAQPKALGRKVSDEFTVPPYRTHHREVHRAGKETNWWKATGIEPLAMAETLWRHGQSGPALEDQGLSGGAAIRAVWLARGVCLLPSLKI
jgi:hypothetical protein